MKYFTINEFLRSETANKLHIDNTPPQDVIDHITEFIETVLDQLRESWGGPITVSSGYRCPQLNKAVGGASTSGHLYGWCADLQVKGDINKFGMFVKNWMTTTNTKYDELIFERSGKTVWVHFAWKGKGGRQRMKCFSMVVK